MPSIKVKSVRQSVLKTLFKDIANGEIVISDASGTGLTHGLKVANHILWESGKVDHFDEKEANELRYFIAPDGTEFLVRKS